MVASSIGPSDPADGSSAASVSPSNSRAEVMAGTNTTSLRPVSSGAGATPLRSRM